MDKKNLSQQLTERAAELATELAKIDSGERPLTKAAKAGVRSNVHWKRRTCLLLANLLEGKELQKSDEETIEHYAIVLERSTLMFEKGQTVITVMQNNPTYSYDRIVKAVEKKGLKINSQKNDTKKPPYGLCSLREASFISSSAVFNCFVIDALVTLDSMDPSLMIPFHTQLVKVSILLHSCQKIAEV